MAARTYLIADPEIGYGFECDSCTQQTVALGWDAFDAIYAGMAHQCEETR